MNDDRTGAPAPPVSLLDYLQQRGWKIVRDSGREEVAGLCPLHRETRPSFYVNRRKQVFYCHGCGRGGGLARLVRWLEGDSCWAPGAGRQTGAPLMEQTYDFYQRQLARSPAAQSYLAARGIHDRAVIAGMRIGYAPGACLRGHLGRLGYPCRMLRERGLIDAAGRDRFFACLTFPLPEAGNLYGRALHRERFGHHFLPGSKGGLYGLARANPRVILVEGLFDVAALWQAGFPETVAALGSHLSNLQLSELCQAGTRLVYLCLDADRNGSGPRAARALAIQLRHAGVEALCVELPCGHDPASFFAAGAAAGDFRRLLERARP